MQLASIKTRLALSFVSAILVTVAVLIAVTYFNARKLVIKETEHSIAELARTNAQLLGTWIAQRQAEVSTLAASPLLDDVGTGQPLTYLEQEVKRQPLYLSFMVMDPKGTGTVTGGKVNQVAERAYFKAVMAGRTLTSDPVIAQDTGKAVVVSAAPIIRNGTVRGGLGGAVTLEDVIHLVGKIKTAQTGYAYVLQQDGKIIFHPDPAMAMKVNALTGSETPAELREICRRMTRGEDGIATYSFQGVTKYLAFAPIPGTSWSLAVNVPAREVLSKLDVLLWSSLAIGIAVLVVALGVSRLLTNGITRPLQAMSDMLQDIAQGDGDLTKRLVVQSQDELGVASQCFNIFVEKLLGIISRVAQTTTQVAGASVQLNQTASQMADNAGQVASQAATVATAGEEMSATAADIAQSCIRAATGSRNASEAAQHGAQVVSETIDVMRSIADQVRRTAQRVAGLGSRSEEIGAIKEIGSMILTIQQETRQAVAAMESGVGEAALGSEKAGESGRALDRILTLTLDVTEQVNQVAVAAEEQTATTAEICTNMRQITDVVANTSQCAQETAAASDQLSGLAEELRHVVGQFKLA